MLKVILFSFYKIQNLTKNPKCKRKKHLFSHTCYFVKLSLSQRIFLSDEWQYLLRIILSQLYITMNTLLGLHNKCGHFCVFWQFVPYKLGHLYRENTKNMLKLSNRKWQIQLTHKKQMTSLGTKENVPAQSIQEIFVTGMFYFADFWCNTEYCNSHK